MKTHVMVNGVNHLTDSPLSHIELHRIAVRCLPEHALSFAEGVSMTWIFGVTRCATEHRRVRRVPPMKTSVMVSEANHLTDSPLSPIELHRITVRCLPLVSMTLIFAVTRRAMEHHRVRLAPPMKTHVMVSEANHLTNSTSFSTTLQQDASRSMP
jgi:hypothetical protein